MIAKPINSISEHEIREALDRIVSWPEFKSNRNSAEFLKYIVNETLEGRGDRIKGYGIAIGALSRSEDFDPQTNSIVRVQAIRLRKQLDEYYAGPGADDPVRIILPLGTYRPSFERPATPGDAWAADVEAPHVVAPFETNSTPSVNLRFYVWLWVAAVLAIVVLAGALVAVRQRPEVSLAPAAAGSDSSSLPTVAIRSNSFEGEPAALRSFTDNLIAELQNRFSAFENLTVLTGAPLASQGRGPVADEDYDLVVTPRDADAGRADVTLKLIWSRTQSFVWTKTYEGVDIRDHGAQAAIVADATFTVADIFGAIDSDMRLRLKGADPAHAQGYACSLLAFDSIRTLTPESRARALHCLEASVASAAEPKREALLAIVLVRGYLDAVPGSQGRADLDRALELARASLEAASFRARPQYVYFLTRFYAGRYEEAFAAAEKALAINPYAATIVASIGTAYISRGDYARGMELLKPLAQLNSTAPVGFLSYAALAAYMQGDDKALAKYVDRPAGSRSALGVLLRAIIGARSLGSPCLERCARDLVGNFPGFAADIPAALDRYQFAEPIKTRLLADLKASGLLDAVAAQAPGQFTPR